MPIPIPSFCPCDLPQHLHPTSKPTTAPQALPKGPSLVQAELIFVPKRKMYFPGVWFSSVRLPQTQGSCDTLQASGWGGMGMSFLG